MRVLLLPILLVGVYWPAKGNQTLDSASFQEYLYFIGDVFEKSKNRMDFKYEVDGSLNVSGFLYFKDETLKLKLFLFNEDDTVGIRTLDPVFFDNRSKQQIRKVFNSIFRYKQSVCYDGHRRINPYSSILPEIEKDKYWHYVLIYSKKGKSRKVKRDKLLLDDPSGCNKRRFMVKERRDFEKLRVIINDVLLANGYPAELLLS